MIKREAEDSGSMLDDGRRCAYDMCPRPVGSFRYYNVPERCDVGGRAWDEWVGKDLCQACFDRYGRTGNLERSAEEFDAEAYEHEQIRRCWYINCPKPTQNDKYYTITAHTDAGGQNWGGLIGKVLCHTCYNHYRQTGTLQRRPGSRTSSQVSGLDSRHISARRTAPKPRRRWRKPGESGDDELVSDYSYASNGSLESVDVASDEEQDGVNALNSRGGAGALVSVCLAFAYLVSVCLAFAYLVSVCLAF
jgi:hypothetical protein